MPSSKQVVKKLPSAELRATSTPAAQRRLMVFHLAGQAYALPLRELQEVVPMAELFRPPGLPSVLAGFLNLAGTAIPVLRLDRLFELPEPVLGLYTPLLLLRHPDYQVALLVDKVSEILAVPRRGHHAGPGEPIIQRLRGGHGHGR